jgi:hypothetical protein
MFKLINEDGLGQAIVRKKYLSNQTMEEGQKKTKLSKRVKRNLVFHTFGPA